MKKPAKQETKQSDASSVDFGTGLTTQIDQYRNISLVKYKDGSYLISTHRKFKDLNNITPDKGKEKSLKQERLIYQLKLTPEAMFALMDMYMQINEPVKAIKTINVKIKKLKKTINSKQYKRKISVVKKLQAK